MTGMYAYCSTRSSMLVMNAVRHGVGELAGVWIVVTGFSGMWLTSSIQSRRVAIDPIQALLEAVPLSRKGIRAVPVMNHADRNRQFDALVRRYADDLYRFGVWLSGDPTLTRDLVQETFMRAWKALDKLKDGRAARSWLITILRREYARTFERKVPPLTDIDEVVVTEESELPPEDRAERALLRKAMLELDVCYREPLVLQVVMGFSIAEIAEQLDLTESAVMTRVFRAREKLKAKLQSGDARDGNVHELS